MRFNIKLFSLVVFVVSFVCVQLDAASAPNSPKKVHEKVKRSSSEDKLSQGQLSVSLIKFIKNFDNVTIELLLRGSSDEDVIAILTSVHGKTPLQFSHDVFNDVQKTPIVEGIDHLRQGKLMACKSIFLILKEKIENYFETLKTDKEKKISQKIKFLIMQNYNFLLELGIQIPAFAF